MSVGITASVFSAWLILLRDLSVKSVLLLLAAWAVTLAMRRASAAARHLIWLLTFAGLLLLPLLSVTLPARSVAVLPPPAAPVVLPSPVAMPSVAEPPAVIEAPTAGVTEHRPAPLLPAPILLPRPVAPHALPPTIPNWPSLLCCLWLLGVVLAALPLAAGWTLAARRIRHCSPVTDPATLALAAEAGRRLGLHRAVSLRSGPAVSVPVTFGLVRPVILLPDGAASWPAERLRVALLHELAHIRRSDWATQTLARLVCALFWHNPMVWPAARMLRAEAERACDDLVLASGVPTLDYAQHLLAVAAALAGANRPLPLAVPMAGRGPLESRLRAILTARPRRAPSRRLAILALALAFVVLIPLAVLRPAARAARRMTLPLTLAPIVPPAPPEAVRRSSAPVKATVAVSPASSRPFMPIKSIPTGVPPMKPLTPVKAIALAVLTASLALPAAQARPTAPVRPPALMGHAPVSVLTPSLTPPQVAPQSSPLPKSSSDRDNVIISLGSDRDTPSVLQDTSVPFNIASRTDARGSITMTDEDVQDILPGLFRSWRKNYVIEPTVYGRVTWNSGDVPLSFDKILDGLVNAASHSFEWRHPGRRLPRPAPCGGLYALCTTSGATQIPMRLNCRRS